MAGRGKWRTRTLDLADLTITSTADMVKGTSTVSSHSSATWSMSESYSTVSVSSSSNEYFETSSTLFSGLEVENSYYNQSIETPPLNLSLLSTDDVTDLPNSDELDDVGAEWSILTASFLGCMLAVLVFVLACLICLIRR